MTDQIFNFDNSLQENVAACEARSIAKHALGRVSRNKKYEADLGSAGHEAMKAFFSGQHKNDVMHAFAQGYDRVIPPGEMPNSDKAEMMERGNLMLIMEQWCDTMTLKRFPFEVVELETTKGIEIAEGFKLWYKRDMLVRELATGELLPVDHKFRWGQITSWWTGKFKNCSQFSCYLWCTEQETGNPCGKQYVNAISFNKLPTSTYKCRVHKVPYTECRKEHVDFQLLTYSRGPEQKAKWYKDMLVLAKHAKLMFQAFGRPELLPFAPRRGAFNGGCVFCEYQEWCRNGFDPAMMEDYTVEQWWKPWEEEQKAISQTEGYQQVIKGIEGAIAKIDDLTVSRQQAYGLTKERNTTAKQVHAESFGPAPNYLEQSQQAARLQWFWRQVNNEIRPSLEGSPGDNWVEIAQPMALKRLAEQNALAPDPQKGPWMKVWNACPQAQEAMAAWVRERQ